MNNYSKIKLPIGERSFGFLPDGREVFLYTLQNQKGCVVELTNYGGIITKILTPDRSGRLGNIILGYDDLSGYLSDNDYVGALIGRYANRIANGVFRLNGHKIQLNPNNGTVHQHGGQIGFNRVVWGAEIYEKSGQPSLKLTYRSADGEEGYPGNLSVAVILTLTNSDELQIEFHGNTDKTGIINLTHHPYFNLHNDHSRSALDHVLKIEADSYLPIDNEILPTGAVQRVADTPFDFRKQHAIADIIHQPVKQLEYAGGYDHCLVINESSDPIRLAASLFSIESGRKVELYTDAPGLQLYTANKLIPSRNGIRGKFLGKHKAICLEPQSFPNAPNVDSFPSTLIRPGVEYRRSIIYRFSVQSQSVVNQIS
ncbi:MAG: aldose epimerase family protein [Candidatus Neomarinimicrobiota bacterium]